MVASAAPMMARRIGSDSSHLGDPISGRMVRSWHTPINVRKSGTGSSSKTESITSDLGA